MSTSDRKIIIVSESEDDGMILIRYFIGLAIAAAVIMLLVAGWAMYKSAQPVDDQEYREALIRYEADPAWRAEWKRLQKKHGNPGVVIYEPGREPYYINAQGRNCRFM